MAPDTGGGSSGARPHILGELETVLRERLANPPQGSYSATLLRDPEQAARKIMEEAFELCIELGRRPVERQRVTSEAADVLFHVVAGVVGAGCSVTDVLTELEARRKGASTPE